MKIKYAKNILLYFLIALPYLASGELLFFTLTYSERPFHRRIESIQESLHFTSMQLNFFMGIIVLLATLLILVFFYIIMKVIITIFDKNKISKDTDLFFSLVIGFSGANFLAIILIDFLSASLATIKIATPIFDLLLFTGLYYFFSKNKKLTPVLFITKLVLLVVNFSLKFAIV